MRSDLKVLKSSSNVADDKTRKLVDELENREKDIEKVIIQTDKKVDEALEANNISQAAISMQEIELQSKGIEEFQVKLRAQIMAEILEMFALQNQKLEQRLGQKLDNHS